jgi:hypothetical protein
MAEVVTAPPVRWRAGVSAPGGVSAAQSESAAESDEQGGSGQRVRWVDGSRHLAPAIADHAARRDQYDGMVGMPTEIADAVDDPSTSSPRVELTEHRAIRRDPSEPDPRPKERDL